MRPDDVHLNEMSLYPHNSGPDDRDDQWPPGDPALAAFVDDLRVIGSGPAPEPRPGLVAVMGQGPSVPAVSTPGRRKMLVKTVLGSLAAKLAFGVGAAAASVTAAGAAGVLPDPAQHAVASVVEATTPFALPDPSTVTDQVRPDILGSTTTTTVGGIGGDNSGDGTGGTRTANHGACVSAVAKSDTGSASHGKTVSSVARSDCGKIAASTSTTVVSPTTTGPGSTTTSTAGTTTTVADDAARTANSGRGNSNGNGNSGNGNSGNRGSGSGNSGRN